MILDLSGGHCLGHHRSDDKISDKYIDNINMLRPK